MINEAINSKTTKIYSGIVQSSNTNGTWNILYNGKVHAVKPYGSIVPKVDTVVKVFIPNGNENLAFFM